MVKEGSNIHIEAFDFYGLVFRWYFLNFCYSIVVFPWLLSSSHEKRKKSWSFMTYELIYFLYRKWRDPKYILLGFHHHEYLSHESLQKRKIKVCLVVYIPTFFYAFFPLFLICIILFFFHFSLPFYFNYIPYSMFLCCNKYFVPSKKIFFSFILRCSNLSAYCLEFWILNYN